MDSVRIFDQHWSATASTEVAAATRRLAERTGHEEAPSVYIQVPFCPTRCISCARAAAVASSPRIVEKYLDYLEREIEQTANVIGAPIPAAQLKVGGGSPNHLVDAHLARIIDIFERYFRLQPGADVAIDINPKRSSRSQMELLSGLGFGSLHFELREIDPSRQFALGRSCTPELLEDVFLTARESGIKYLHFDYVYGMPGHTHTSVREAAQSVAELGPDRVMCHPFFRREDLFPHQQLIDAQALPSSSERMGLFTTMVDTLENAGYVWVGMNGFVRQSDPLIEAQERGELHLSWLGYTDRPRPWMLGFGLGATSELPGLMTRNSLELEEWYRTLDAGPDAVIMAAEMSNEQMMVRDAVLQLGANLRAPFGARRTSDTPIASSAEIPSINLPLEDHWEEALVEQRPFSLFR